MNQRKTRTGEELPESRQPATARQWPGAGSHVTEHRRLEAGGTPLPGQGVGAWSWVSRKGAKRVMDRDLATGFTGFTSVLDQPGSARSYASEQPELTDWGIPYSGSQFSVGFAHSVGRRAGGSSLVIEEL